MSAPAENSLVLYKNRPARVMRSGDKVEIELEGGKSLKVRPKDVILLHPGPLMKLSELKAMSGEVEIAWEILAGETTTILELAELIFDDVTPSTAWEAWEYVAEGLYFHGQPDEIHVRSADELEKEKAVRDAKDADDKAWSDFINRVQDGKILPAEAENLSGVEALAYGRTAQSRVLRELGRGASPENAHALLLRLGHWDDTTNPYPYRFDLSTDPPIMELPELPDEPREDFTHLPAFAIDDEGNQDPDDAISLVGDRLIVHVADAAALIRPRTTLDNEARTRTGNLYLPEGATPMLPHGATEILGLGLQEVSPALSFSLRLSEDGEISDVEIMPSLVKVTRLSYAEAEERLDVSPLREIWEMTQKFGQLRRERGAISIDLPEVKVRVLDGEVIIQPLPKLRSREMVTDAMLMAGEAAARFAIERQIPFPFTVQDPPDTKANPKDMAGMFAYRKHFKRSKTQTLPDSHTGLGLSVYTRTTSPLRRYLDLVAHQQLRAFLKDEPLLAPQEITERVGAVEAMTDSLRRAERFSNKHWTLVHLKRNPNWQGVGVLVDKKGKRGIVIIPELGLETQIQLDQDYELNSEIKLKASKVNLPELSARFNIEP